jgi:hypothetical protein
MDSEPDWILKLRERINQRTAEDWGDIAIVGLVLASWVYICVLAFTGNL